MNMIAQLTRLSDLHYLFLPAALKSGNCVLGTSVHAELLDSKGDHCEPQTDKTYLQSGSMMHWLRRNFFECITLLSFDRHQSVHLVRTADEDATECHVQTASAPTSPQTIADT